MFFLKRYQSQDRKSTRLNSSHSQISYAVFCLKNEALTGIRNRTDDVGGKRDLSVETRELWEGAGFSLLESQPIIVHSHLPPGKTFMHHLMVLHAELAIGVPLDPELLEEIFAWSLDPNFFFQYGLLGHVFLNPHAE